jgi:hypothetical protein
MEAKGPLGPEVYTGLLCDVQFCYEAVAMDGSRSSLSLFSS